MSEEDIINNKTVDVDQGGCTSNLPYNVYKNKHEDQNLTDKEIKTKPPIFVSKEICLHSNHDHLGVIKFDNIYVCLICKTDVHFSELDPCNKIHLDSNEHKVNQSELFEQCFYNSGLNSTNKEIYKILSSNSYIDFSSATEISTNKESDICFVCRREIPTLNNSQSISVNDILNHFKDNNHIRNIQDNFSWTFNLLSKGQLTLYKSLFYCSVCEESFSCGGYHLIQTAVNHLESKHIEDCVGHGLEDETICLKKKTSQGMHSTASGESSDDQLEDVSDDLYATCSDEDFSFEDDLCIPSTSGVILTQIREDQTVNNDQEHYLYVCIECGENIEIIDDDFEISLQLHSASHEREKDDTFVLPTRNSHKEEKRFNALDNLYSAAISSSKEFVVDKHLEVLIQESAFREASKDIPNGHNKQDHKQTNVKQTFPTKKKNKTEIKFFSDLSDCLPENFHKDLSFVAIKSNQLYCELCICSVGVALNVFDSSYTLHNHFSSLYHKNQMDLVSDITNENNKPEIKQSFSNKTKGEKMYINSNFKKTDVNNYKLTSSTQKQNEFHDSRKYSRMEKLTEGPEYNSSSSLTVQKPHDLSVSNNGTCQAANQTNMSSNISSKDKTTSDFKDISSLIVPNQAAEKAVPSSSSLIIPEHFNNYEIDSAKSKKTVSSIIADLLNDSNLRVHHEFFKHNCTNIYCCLCSSDFDGHQADLIDHITGIKHKVQFLSLLKKSLKESQRHQVKFLLFMSRQLYCSICKCYITPWNSFVEICQGVEAHFKREVHSVSDGGKQIRSTGTNQEIRLKNENTSIVEGKVESESGKDENKREPRHVLSGNSSNTSCESVVENHPQSTELVAIINNDSASRLNLIMSTKKVDMKENKKGKITIVEGNVESESGIDEKKQEPRNILSGNSSNKSFAAVVENHQKSTKLVANINNDSASGLNKKTSPKKVDMKEQPVKRFSETLKTNNIKIISTDGRRNFAGKSADSPEGSRSENPFPTITKVSGSIKMELSLKRLITSAPLVRVNKDFIEQRGEHFNCILCSESIPYSPQKYVLAKNFNSHFKSAIHILNVNKLSKVESFPRISQIKKIKCKETHRLPKVKSLDTSGEKSLLNEKSVEKKNESVTAVLLPLEDSQSNDSKLNPSISKNKCIKVIKTVRAKVFTTRTSSLKRFIKKYKTETGLNLFENKSSDYISNKFVSRKLHPLLQKLVPDVPLLQVNKQYIVRSNINFYCTLCCKNIYFSTKSHRLAKYFNSHFKSKTHTSLLRTIQSGVGQGIQNATDSSPKSLLNTVSTPSSHVATKAESDFWNVLSKGKTMFKETYDTLIKLQNEEIFFCNVCVKNIRAIPYKSFEYSIIQHCLKFHKRGSNIKNSGLIGDLVWNNNILKANIIFMEMSHQGAACGICCRPVTFSKNYNILIFNFLLHFQDEKHRLVAKSTKQNYAFQSLCKESNKYKPNLKLYEANSFV